MADRVGVMRDGRLEQIAAPDELYAHAGHGVRRRVRRHHEPDPRPADRDGDQVTCSAPSCRCTARPTGRPARWTCWSGRRACGSTAAAGRQRHRHRPDLPRLARPGSASGSPATSRSRSTSPAHEAAALTPGHLGPGRPWTATRSWSPRAVSTTRSRARRSDAPRAAPAGAGRAGRRRLSPAGAADGEPHHVRDELAGASLPGGWRRTARPLLVLAHLSDTHVMDHQSPGRAELLDRYSDPDSPLRAEVGIIGTYRAQELFTFRSPRPWCRAVREHGAARCRGAPVDFAVVTGDATDNCQRNELRSLHRPARRRRGRARLRRPAALRGGGRPRGRRRALLASRTAARTTCPGPATAFPLRRACWTRPGGRSRPLASGCPGTRCTATTTTCCRARCARRALAARRSCPAGSSCVTPPDGVRRRRDRWRGSRSADGDALMELAAAAADGHRRSRPGAGAPGRLRPRALPDPAQPAGHGYTRRNADDGHRLLRLRPRRRCAAWCSTPSTRTAAGRARSTRPSSAGCRPSWPPRGPAGGPVQPPPAGDAGQRPAAARRDRRVLAAELREVLLAHPCVVAWVNGHTHVHAVTAVTDGAGRGFWQITTASHIDWPQQATDHRAARGRRGLAIACTVIDSAAPRQLRRALTRWPTWPPCPASWPPTTGRSGT